MKINVAQLLKEPLGSTRKIVFHRDDLEGGPVFQGRAELLRTGRGILVRARLETVVAETCARCLADFSRPAAIDFEEEFFPTVGVESGLPLEVPEAEAFTIDAQHILDLSEALRQYQMMEEPIRVLCRPDCQGLCPRCGADLNQGPCDCPPEAKGPLGALAALRDSQKEKKRARKR